MVEPAHREDLSTARVASGSGRTERSGPVVDSDDVKLSDPGEASWRVFYTAARAEKKCEAVLQRRRIEVLVPKVHVTRKWRNGVRKTIEEPLFPNYLFARVSERERIEVLETRGIVRSVMFGRKLAAIPTVEIERLLIAQRHPKLLSRMVEPLPSVGQWVEVKSGPLQGLRGPVLDYRGRTYVVVRISPINQCARVQIPAENLVPC